MNEQQFQDMIVKCSDTAARKICDLFKPKGINPEYISGIIRESFGDTRSFEVKVFEKSHTIN